MAVIGAGYWGPNLIRNLSATDRVDLRWVCDLDPERARRAVGRYSTVAITTSVETVLDDPSVQAVAIATPPGTHCDLGLAAIEAGKHVLVEKPLAASVAEGEKLVQAAHDHGRVLMCDHTYCYTPVVQRIREMVVGGELGDIQYVDSVRINLGLVQRDVDVLWDLAPHDLSILDHVLPEDVRPIGVSAIGADPIGAGRACLAYLTLPLRGGAVAHAHVNWLSPTKIRQTIIAGSRRMLVWDDLHPAARLQVFEKGVEIAGQVGSDERLQHLVSYRVGDMVAPALPEREALRAVADEFTSAILEGRPAATDGEAGLRVLKVLHAASASLQTGGALVPLADLQALAVAS
jgi:predicted dehydrogenase